MRFCGVPAKTVIEHLDAIHFYRNGKEWPEEKWQADLVEEVLTIVQTPGSRVSNASEAPS
jgi:hypothetical protein